MTRKGTRRVGGYSLWTSNDRYVDGGNLVRMSVQAADAALPAPTAEFVDVKIPESQVIRKSTVTFLKQGKDK